ncbi:hypothetical protein CWO90_18645 [Bradyrhizobium sp. Leo121]|nr:hypothetical protein CWO90_18645 [Bradyrhizobium sp. Leo121]
MIRKSGDRFSEKIMLKQRDEIMIPILSNRIMIQDVFFPVARASCPATIASTLCAPQIGVIG